MRKLLGIILIAPLICIGIIAFIYNIISAGWYFILSVVIIAFLAALALIGINLLFKK